MGAMLKPDSVFTFGMHKGKTVAEVFEDRPDYLCWMRQTGFSDFGKEITEAIFTWEEMYPEEVEKIKKSIARKKAAEIAEAAEKKASKVATDEDERLPPLHNPLPPPVVPKTAPAAWGSW